MPSVPPWWKRKDPPRTPPVQLIAFPSSPCCWASTPCPETGDNILSATQHAACMHSISTSPPSTFKFNGADGNLEGYLFGGLLGIERGMASHREHVSALPAPPFCCRLPLESGHHGQTPTKCHMPASHRRSHPPVCCTSLTKIITANTTEVFGIREHMNIKPARPDHSDSSADRLTVTVIVELGTH